MPYCWAATPTLPFAAAIRARPNAP